jgi:hypothetical protein
MEVVAFVAGIAVLALVVWDVFETIVVPRPTPGWFRIARYIVRSLWTAWRGFAIRQRSDRRRDVLLGLFAPATTMILLAVWLAVLILGFGLLLFGLRTELRPIPTNLGTSIYFAATSVLTLGFGDIVAVGAPARVAIVLAAGAGLGIVALVVTFLFSITASYQRREIRVVMLQSTAGAPPSAIALLEGYARLGMVAQLPELFREWQQWSAEVLDSHVAFPLLCFFRSSHDNLSWLSALGAVLDAAALVLTTISDLPRGEAELAKLGGAHLVEDLSNLGFQGASSDGIDRDSFDIAYRRLAEAGYTLNDPDVSWERFGRARATFAARLEAMAEYWAVPSTSLLGEMPHKLSSHSVATRPIATAMASTTGGNGSDGAPGSDGPAGRNGDTPVPTAPTLTDAAPARSRPRGP